MRKKVALIAAILGLCLSGSIRAIAQDTNEGSKPSAPKPITAYRLEFYLNELEDGKKINTRHYTMNTTDDSSSQDLKIGTRVPVQSGEGKFEYLDVGTSIRARLISFKTPMSLDVHADISNFAMPDDVARGGRPLVRQMVINGSSTVVTDKPILIGSVDDPNSKREYQLEVTVTRLK